MTELPKMISQYLNDDQWYRLISYLAQFQFIIITYKEISHDVNQIYSGHNCLVIPVSSQFPDVQEFLSMHMDMSSLTKMKNISPDQPSFSESDMSTYFKLPTYRSDTYTSISQSKYTGTAWQTHHSMIIHFARTELLGGCYCTQKC